jgi:hypothetical protein
MMDKKRNNIKFNGRRVSGRRLEEVNKFFHDNKLNKNIKEEVVMII